jgi:ABC-type transport system involved in Fe-S cluster assembly fused permease/ATPase subunit
MAHREFDRSVFQFFDHIINLSMRFHMDSNSGQLVKKITKGVDGVFSTQIDVFRRAMPNIFIVVILIPTVIYFNTKL